MQQAQTNLERLERARSEFAGLIIEMIARLDESERLVWTDLLDPTVRAAELAATLGFSAPPVEVAVIRPGGTSDPVLDANPAYTHVHRLRVHDPYGLTHQNLLLGATHRRTNSNR